MIASPGLHAKLQTVVDKLSADGGGSGEGGDFLQALMGELPAEARELKPEELVAWLEDHAVNLLPASAVPVDTAVPAYGQGGDPVSLLGALMSTRPQDMALMGAAQGEEAMLQAGLLEAANAEAALDADAFPLMAQTASARALDSRATSTDVPEFVLRTPVQHQDFGQALGERLTWLVRQDVQQARIILDPPNLGPLEITLSIKDDQASVMITAQHPLTREVIEADSQRLRGMLGDNGFSMVDVNVSQGQQQQQGGEQRPSLTGSVLANGIDGAEEGAQGETRVERRGLGLVDHYA